MSVTTTELAIAALALAGVSLVLFVLALRRLLSRQGEITMTMLRRYDERLATFAQTLNDAVAAFQAPPALTSPNLEDDPEPMLRTLELARERTRADGAIALVTSGTGTPIVATVGLSESETNHIARMGFPDYRGARAIEVAFTGDLLAPDGEQPVRGGLVLPLLEEGDAQSLLGVLTREKGRHFSEEDVDALDGVVRVARSPVARALNLREPDVVPGDRPPHEPPRPSVLHRGARARDRPLAPRRASALAPRAGRRPADEPQRAPRPRRRRRRAPRARAAPPGGDPPSGLHVPNGRGPLCRAAAGSRGRSGAGALRGGLRGHRGEPARGGGGRLALGGRGRARARATTPESFAARAEAGLQHAKLDGRGTIVLESGHEVSREALVLHAASGDATRRG